MRSLDRYCRGSGAGQFAYAPDCHKFVNCGGAGLAYLQECPADLVFDPFVGACNWPQVQGECRSLVQSPRPAYPPPLRQPPQSIVTVISPPTGESWGMERFVGVLKFGGITGLIGYSDTLGSLYPNVTLSRDLLQLYY